MAITIEKNLETEWQKYSEAGIDFVPDPMILRTAELFFNGKSGCKNAGLNTDEVWESIDKNISALLTFFDIIMTRKKIPLFQYWETFDNPPCQLSELLGTLCIPVSADYRVYDSIKTDALSNLENVDFDRLPDEMVKEIEDELGAFRHNWHPDLDGIDIPPEKKRVAEFLLGGMIFSGYAQATESDHIIQSKRSRIFTELMIPQDEKVRWGYEQEKNLFAAFKRYCHDRGDANVDDFSYAPNILPYLLMQHDGTTAPRELLDSALAFREKDVGQVYGQWFQKLRKAWSLGRKDKQAEDNLRWVHEELKRQFQHKPIKGKVHASVEINNGGFKVEIPVDGLNAWIKGWFIKCLPSHKHRKLLLQMYLDEKSYQRLDIQLKKHWFAG